MATSNTLSADVQAELIRRHKSTATTVLSLLVAVVLLTVLALVGQKFLRQRDSLSLDMAFRIIVPILGLGAIPLRRTRLAKMRLQDIAAIRGVSGLLATLQKTALLMAMIGIAVALIGFASTLITGQVWYMYTAAVVAAAILLFYGYPLRPSWEQAVQQYSPLGEDSPTLMES
jgi:membrane protein implicated in regulation of membrane protease activity